MKHWVNWIETGLGASHHVELLPTKKEALKRAEELKKQLNTQNIRVIKRGKLCEVK